MVMTEYSELKIQDYMKSENIKMKDALNLFKFRTHCAKKIGTVKPIASSAKKLLKK